MYLSWRPCGIIRHRSHIVEAKMSEPTYYPVYLTQELMAVFLALEVVKDQTLVHWLPVVDALQRQEIVSLRMPR